MKKAIKKMEEARRLASQLASQQTYYICYSHPQHGSDQIGCTFASASAAEAEIALIQKDPGQAGYVEWLAESCLWVTDDAGNIY